MYGSCTVAMLFEVTLTPVKLPYRLTSLSVCEV